MKVNTAYTLLLAIYMLVQAVYVLFFPLPFISDSWMYLNYAQSAILENTYYPHPGSLYSDWIITPVYINWLIVLLKISKSTSTILWANILLNTLQLVLIYKVTEKLFSSKAAIIAGCIYMLYLNNIGLVLLNLTELPFGVLILSSLYFYLQPSSIKNNVLCGLMAGLALGVRPTAWALILSFLIVYLINAIRKNPHHLKLAGIAAGMLLYIIPMGILANRNVGKFEYTSTHGPANLIMSANPKAAGVFDGQAYMGDSVYRSKKTYIEKNEYLLARSKQYLQEHPWSWLSLIPRKAYSTFISDVWAVPKLLHSMKWDLNVYLKGNAEVKNDFKKESLFFRIAFWTLNCWQQLIYGVIALFFMYQLYSFLRTKDFSDEKLIINLFIVGGVALTLITSIGSPRYKYTYLMMAIVLISPYVEKFLNDFIFPLIIKKQVK